MKLFNNRKLTKQELQFHKNKQCIACGIKMEADPVYKKIDGKVQIVGEKWFLECKDCYKTRTNIPSLNCGDSYYPHYENSCNKYKHILGYASKDTA